MQWSSVEEFWAMGGHGLFVWGSYAVTLAVMLLEPLWAAQRHRQALRAVRDLPDDQA